MMDHISYSQLNTLLNCGIQYEFRWIKKVIVPPPASLVRGACGHKANEKNFAQKIETRIDLPRTEVEEAFSDEWNSRKYGIGWREEELAGESPKKAEGRWKDSGIKLVGIYHTEQAPLVQPISVEEKFRVEFHGDFPPMDGIIDRITEEGAVEDDKFVSKAPTEDDALKDIQLTAYHVGYKSKYGKNPVALRKRYAIDTKKPKTIVREAPPREQDQIDRFLFRLEAAMKSVKTGVFVPCSNTWWGCSARWCGYYSQCSYRV